MKALLGLLGLAAVALLLRSTALSVLAARGVVLDVLAFATVVWALHAGERWGSTFGFVLGLAADLDAAQRLGRHALALAVIGYVLGRLSRSLVRDSARTQFVLLLCATFVHQAWIQLFELGGPSGLAYLGVHAGLAALTTAPAGVLVLALLRWGGGQPLFGHASVQPGPPR